MLNLQLLSAIALYLRVRITNLSLLTHQTAHATVADVNAHFLQLFGHPWSAIAAQAETQLFLDMSQRDRIRPLSAAGWTAATCP